MTDKRQEAADEIWNKVCSVFREEGIHISNYIDEVSGLLFLKMYEQSNRYVNDSDSEIPEGAKWQNLLRKANESTREPLEDEYGEDMDTVKYYVAMIKELSNDGPLMEAGFTGFETRFADDRSNDSVKTLNKTVRRIENLEVWDMDKEEPDDIDYTGLAYEELLKRYADNADGAGQYLTKRPLIRAIVDVVNPSFGDTIHDPAAGTAGFLIEAYKHVLDNTDNYRELEDVASTDIREFEEGITGIELVPETRRLGLLNMITHDMKVSVDEEEENVNGYAVGDSLRKKTYSRNDIPTKNDVVLANPPFGSAYNGTPNFNKYMYESSDIEVIFLQQIMSRVSEGGEAGVVVPEGILFGGGSASKVRRDLLKNYNLKCILVLPEDSFQPYAGVDSNVLFFENPSDKTGEYCTDEFWYYDARSEFENIKKSNPLRYQKHFSDFVDNWNNKTESDNYFKVSIDEVDKDNYELHLKKYKEFKYEGHRPPAEIAQDIKTELATIETELDQMVGENDD